MRRWTKRDQQQAWQRLHRIEADPARYPEQARDLPHLGRWVAATSGNPILDTPPPDDLFILTYSWDRLSVCRVDWQQARRLLHHADRLLEWFQQDSDNLAVLTQTLIKGVDYDCLTW